MKSSRIEKRVKVFKRSKRVFDDEVWTEVIAVKKSREESVGESQTAMNGLIG
jgi:hypothetical protein